MVAQRYGYMYGRMTAFAEGGEFTQKNAVTRDLMVSDKVFALDTETGRLLWEYAGQRIANITVVLGEGQIFLADSAVTAEQRSAASTQRRELIQAGIYQERPQVVEELNAKKQLLAQYVAQKQTLVESQGDTRQLDALISQVTYLIDSLASGVVPEGERRGQPR